MSEKDDAIIAQYTSGKPAELAKQGAELCGGIDRVENGKFIFGNGRSLSIRPKSLLERWAEEDKVIEARGGW